MSIKPTQSVGNRHEEHNAPGRVVEGLCPQSARLKKEEEEGQRGCRGAGSCSYTLEAVGLANFEEVDFFRAIHKFLL